MRARTFLLVLAVLVPASVHAAEAQTETRLREALRASQGQLRALEDERLRWQATQAAQKNEIESLRAQLELARRKARATREPGPTPDLTLRLAEQTEANRKLSESLAQSQAATREAAEQARRKDDQRAQLVGQVSLLAARATSCEAKHARLFRLTHELLERYQNKDAGGALVWLEPFLGFRRVEAENFSQEFEDQLLEQR